MQSLEVSKLRTGVLEIPRSEHIYSFSRDARPALEVDPGAVVIFDTFDAFSGQITSPEDRLEGLPFDRINPATGPLYVRTARPGDALAVSILSLQTSARGSILSIPGEGALGDRVAQSTTRIVRIGEHWIEFAPGIRLPKRPMMGVIGVAPSGEPISCGIPGRHGGNMDTNTVTTGATLYLPVQIDGALLAMGDAHALQGDGEVCGTGVECEARATISVNVIEDYEIEWPMLVNSEDLMFIVSAQTLDEASREAVHQIVMHLMNGHDMSFDDAYMLMSCVGSLRISQIVDPLVTVRSCIPRRYL